MLVFENIKDRILTIGILGLFSLIIFTSCEDFFVRDADNVDIPGGEPLLVVYSFISPTDSIIRVHVRRSQPYVLPQSSVTPVGNKAKVFMGEKGKELVQLPYNEDFSCYMLYAKDFPVEAGKSYVLEVEFKDEKVKAECYVPLWEVKEVVIEDPILLTQTHEDPYSDWSSSFTELSQLYSIQPKKQDRESFYFSNIFIKSYYVDYQMESENDPEPEEVIRFNHNRGYMERGQEYFSDSDGEIYNFRSQTYLYQNYYNPYSPDSDLELPNDSLFLFVLQTDYHYYRFHANFDLSVYGADEPFTESVLTYSNIEGGFGVFAGYNKQHFFITELEEDSE